MTDADDLAAVEALLGRRVQGDFEVVVRHADGSPVVLRNAPLLHDGTPMPTRYWLVGEPERTLVSRLEAAGGVRPGGGGRSICRARRRPRPLRRASATRCCPPTTSAHGPPVGSGAPGWA